MTTATRAMQRQTQFPTATGVPGGSVSINNTVSTTFSGTVSVTFSGTGSFNAGGFATTAAPTYTDSTTQSLSLDTVGNLRTSVNNTVSVTFSGTINTTGTFNASGFATSATPSYTNSTTQAFSLNLAGDLRTTVSGIANTVSVTGTFWPATQPVSGAINIAAAGTGGYVPSTSAALSTASFSVTNSAATLGGYFVGNPNTGSFAYVQIFDTGSFTLGTTAPKVVLSIPAGAAANLQCLIAFTASIGVAAATTPTGSASVTSALVASFWYK